MEGGQGHAGIRIEGTEDDLGGPLTTEAAGEGKILGLDGDTLSVDGSKVGVLEEGDKVRLGRLLERHDGR